LAARDQNNRTGAPGRDTGATPRIPNRRTILQADRLQFCKNRLAQPASGRGPMNDIPNRNGGRCCDGDDGKRDADGMSSHEDVDLPK
jgi:hypothetical protein